MNVQTDYLTRREAADYLRISTRTLDRMSLPRAYVRSKPLYERSALDAALVRHSPHVTSPTIKPVRLVVPSRRSRDGDDWLDSIRAALA